MSDLTVHQALFGYSQGHRLLSASGPIDSDSMRVLRSVSDMAFEGKAHSYLTVTPLPKVGQQAFIRTWRADNWLRAGSVWSHVLLVDHSILGDLTDPATVLGAFRKPPTSDSEATAASIRDLYARPLELVTHPQRSPALDVDVAGAERILSAVYGFSGAATLVSPDVERLELTLMAAYFQQWPRLRRSFSMRTRARATEGLEAHFDLQVVERGESSKALSQTVHPVVSYLAQDLVSPDLDLRRFFRRYGAQSEAGKSDAIPLAAVYLAATTRGSTSSDVARALLQGFPAPGEMRLLKRDLFMGGEVRLPNWPDGDAARLGLALLCAEGLDFADLEVGTRIASIALDPVAGSDVLAEDLVERLPRGQVEALVFSLAEQATVTQARELARLNQQLGLLVVSRRPDFLEDEVIWSLLDIELLGEIFRATPRVAQRRVLSGLLAKGAAHPLALICARDSRAWWHLLKISSESAGWGPELVMRGDLLREVLERVGTASLADAPKSLSKSAATLLVLAADLTAGLWRRAPMEVLLNAARDANAHHETESLVRDRLNVAVLVGATSSGQRDLRVSAWERVFEYLHGALALDNFDGEAWRMLDLVLPAGPYWDRCLRLRRGAIAEIERDRLSHAEIVSLAQAAGEHGDRLIAELNSERERKSHRGIFRELLRLFSQ